MSLCSACLTRWLVSRLVGGVSPDSWPGRPGVSEEASDPLELYL
jgi:hypothetical protein